MFPFPFSSKRTSGTGGSGASTPTQSGGQTSLTDPSLQSTASNVPWQGGNAAISLPLSAHLLARSKSFPTLAPTAGPSRPKTPKHFSHQISSTQTLKLDPRIVSGSDDGYFGSGSKPLSPIVEQDYFSPERRSLPLPAEDTAEKPVTAPNESDLSDTPRQSPVYSTFLARPLKRSISQMSQATLRTHRSTSSMPPCIPPLDLRPAFSGNIESPPLLTPSRLTAAPLPPIPAATAGPSNEYLGDSDASSLHADSFISARSAAPSTRNGLGQRIDPDPYSRAEQGSIIRSSTTHSRSASSSNVGRRWTTSLSFGSDLLLFSKSREKSQHSQTSHTAACLLFWLGFLAPWCWMIGGWMLTESGQTKREGNNASSLRLFIRDPKKASKKGIEGVGKEKAAGVPSIEGYGFAHGYPFVAPSVESLTSSGKVLRMKPTASPKALDPWVVKCRVAAVTSGILLLTGFVVAFVEVGKGR